MIDFNMEYYRVFYHVAKLGSFTKAAEALFISQPAVSQAIQKLERKLDCTLFFRDKRRSVRLTEAGEVLFEHVSAAFEYLMQGESALTNTLHGCRGSIRISATETPLYMVVLPMLGKLRSRYPDISVRLSGGGSAKASAGALRAGEVDIAMGVMPAFPTEGLTTYLGSPVKSVAVVHRDFPIAQTEPLTIRQLSVTPLIYPDKGSSARMQIDQWSMEQGVLIEPTFSVQTSSVILSLTKQGYGIGILPEYFAQKDINHGLLKALTLEKPLPERRIVIAHQTDLQKDSLCGLFMDFLKETSGVQQ